MNSEAVLDRETGLVWEQSPDTSTENWGNASYHCLNLAKGGKKGWRLPTVDELTSLVDPTQSNPALPAGHPFSDVQSSDYWSATTAASYEIFARAVGFHDGGVDAGDKSVGAYYTWCVRGGKGLDAQ
jgi:hypothetical protein